MESPSTDRLREAIAELERRLRQRDGRMQVVCATGVLLAMIFFWVPSFSARTGAVVAMLGLCWSIWQCRQWRNAFQAREGAEVGNCRARALEWMRMEVDGGRSVFGLLVFLVAINLVWWGLPVGENELLKAWCDCALLGFSVLLFSLLYCHKQATTRRELAVFVQQFHPPGADDFSSGELVKSKR